MECPPCLTRTGTRGDRWRYGNRSNSPWGVVHKPTMVRPMEEGPPYPAKICSLNHVNITSVASELCWSPLNSETVIVRSQASYRASILSKVILFVVKTCCQSDQDENVD